MFDGEAMACGAYLSSEAWTEGAMYDLDVTCRLPNGHAGPHEALVTWNWPWLPDKKASAILGLPDGE